MPLNFKVADYEIKSEMLSRESSISGSRNLFQGHITMNSRVHGNGPIFTCGSLSIALIWARNSEFNFDSHFHNKEVYPDANAKAALLEFSSLTKLNNYIRSYYETNYSGNLMTLQYDTLKLLYPRKTNK